MVVVGYEGFLPHPIAVFSICKDDIAKFKYSEILFSNMLDFELKTSDKGETLRKLSDNGIQILSQHDNTLIIKVRERHVIDTIQGWPEVVDFTVYNGKGVIL